MENLKKGEKTAGTAIWLEGTLVIAKTTIGLLSGSLVLISDAIHSASDFLSIITSWLGLKIAQKKADKQFHYGYYKAENLGTLIISFLILYASLKMFTNGYARIFSFSSIKIPLFALAISLIDAVVLFFFGNYEIKVGKEVNAESLIAMGKENKTHIFSSTAVFIGTLTAYYNIPYLEGFITIIISFLILKIGFSSGKNAVFSLMDVSPSEEVEKKIIKIIKSVSGVEDFFDLRLRKSGPFILGETKIGVRKSIDVKKSHDIADKIEEKIKRKIPEIESFMVHIEPFKSNWNHLVIPIEQKEKGLNSKIAVKFARAPYFLFINLKNKKIVGFYILKNPYSKKTAKAGLQSAKFAVKQKSGTLITRQIGEIAFYTLKDNLFDIYKTKDSIAKQAIKNFKKGSLAQLKNPIKSV